MTIALIVGLGNPGPNYEATRHNAGFWFVDRLAQRCGENFRPESKFHGTACRIKTSTFSCWLLKPTTFMNRSGQAINALARFYKISPEQILVVHDELDLPTGVARLKKGGGHGGHNGLRDTIAHLGNKNFMRLRLGIDHPGNSKAVVDYVLKSPSRADQEAIDMAIDNSLQVINDICTGQFDRAMNTLHSQKV